MRGGLTSTSGSSTLALPNPNVPSNDAFAFTQIPLRAATREANRQLDTLASHSEWPEWLDNPNLLVIRSPGDTVALIRSQPYRGLGFGVPHPDSTLPWVRFHLDPPQHVTSLATLVTGGRTYKDPVGQFADGGEAAASSQGDVH